MNVQPANQQESGNVNVSPCTSTQILPIKGILKRASSSSHRLSSNQHININNQSSYRTSPDLPDKPITRIPKLSLTWSEKNAVAVFGDTTSDENNTENDSICDGTRLFSPSSKSFEHSSVRQTAIIKDDDSEEIKDEDPANIVEDLEEISEIDDEDESNFGSSVRSDSESVSSNTTTNNNSHIAGKWWFGRSTKYVPHCAKWGCKHTSSECSSTTNIKYITPTQRMTKEIHHLKKQLKLAHNQLKDKEAYLNEMRAQLKGLEEIMNSSNIISSKDNKKDIIDNFQEEKRFLIQKHEIRITQLIQEAVESRNEAAKYKAMVNEIHGKKLASMEKETMTEIMEMTPDVPTPCSAHPDPPHNFIYSPVTSPQPDKIYQIPNEILHQLQAYQNEAFIWRNKAAQLEIVLKDQIIKSQQNNLEAELLIYKNECERLKATQESEKPTTMDDSGIETHVNIMSTSSHQFSSTDCFSPLCTDRKKELIYENCRLLEQVDEQKARISEYNEGLLLLRNTIQTLESENERNSSLMEEMAKEIEEKTAEAQAANMSLIRLQSEISTKNKAICYLEERHQTYRNIILDNNLVVTDEFMGDWRHGFSDPRYVVNLSKRVQTDLTSDALRHTEAEFMNLHDKIKELKLEFSSKNIDMNERFGEIEKNLEMKTSLVQSLTNQLNESDKEAIRSYEQYEKNREEFQSKILELSRIAERVPLLEFEIERLHQERGLLELKLQSTKEEYENGLEATLTESLKKYREQSSYWADKISCANIFKENLIKEKTALERELSELRLKTDIEKADMARRLTSSIDHVSLLTNQINRRTRDVEIDAHPRVASKYVACRPNSRNKMTDIEKGDLFDESEERLKLCQGELLTTRHQVEILQQKLIDNAQVHVTTRLSRAVTTPLIKAPEESEIKEKNSGKGDTLSILKAKIDELEDNNLALLTRLRQSDDEKNNLLSSQKNQIAQLISEFDNLKNELDQEIGQYEAERFQLKNRIEMLEMEKKERDKIISDMPTNGPELLVDNSAKNQTSILDKADISLQSAAATIDENAKHPNNAKRTKFKRCLSVPEIIKNSRLSYDTVNILRERNSVLARANSQLTQELNIFRQKIETSIQRTASTVNNVSSSNVENLTSYGSELSTNFSDIADEINQVRIDLENILTEIDNSMGERKSEQRFQGVKFDVKEGSVSSLESDNTERLRRSLKRLKDERDSLHEQLDRITIDFQDACRELELYKREPRSEVTHRLQNGRLQRSRSFVEIGRGTVDLDEHLRWKEKAGTMFRELNRMRNEYRLCDAERRELRVQLIMIKGELGLAQCQLAELSTRRERGSVFLTPIQKTKSPKSPTVGTSSSDRRSVRDTKLNRSRVSGTSDRCDSTTTFITAACTSFWSLNDLTSISEPDLYAERHERRRDIRSPHRLPQKIVLNMEEESRQEHNEIIKEAAKSQIAALKREMDWLKSQMEKFPRDSEEMDRIKKELQMVNDEYSKSKKEASERNEKLTVELEKAQSNLKILKSTLEDRQLKDDLATKKLTEEMEAIKAENTKLINENLQQRTSYETRLSFLNTQNEIFAKKMDDMEKERQEMYLVMFKKGREAAEHDVQETKVLDEMTEDRIVLRFLHDAFYYYLLNKGDSREHLQAIMTMLNFSRQQKDDVFRKRGASH